jgi:glyceraldehyde 3-phosphate dehydrogenase
MRQDNRVALNGLGRVGRAALKLLVEAADLDVVAVNDLVDAEVLAYQLNFDAVYGRYSSVVHSDHDSLLINGQRIPVFAEPDPAGLPWDELDVTVVLDCTGEWHEEYLAKHITAGARFVVVCAATTSINDDVATLATGVDRARRGELIRCASSSTACVAPLMEVARRRLGAERGVMTTLHAYTSTPHSADATNVGSRRVPGVSGAFLLPARAADPRAVVQAIPELAGRFDGIAIHVPVPAASIADVVFATNRPLTAAEVNDVYCQEAASAQYTDILGVAESPLTSTDIIGDSRAAVVDLDLTRVVDRQMVKVMAWFDNEQGFGNQMIRAVRTILRSTRR